MKRAADVIVVGAGLAGLVAATEVADAGKRVIVVEQETEQNLGGQAFWSLGGLFMVDTPEQRRLRHQRLATSSHCSDWMGTAGFDRDEDHWPRKWAEAYVAFAAGEKRAWLHPQGMRWFPVVGWAERGGYGATGHGNSVPRFHITWGTGPGVLAPFVAPRARRRIGRAVDLPVPPPRRRALIVDQRRGRRRARAVLEPTQRWSAAQASSRRAIGDFELRGAGGHRRLRRHRRQPRSGARELARAAGRAAAIHVQGVPGHVDGRMLDITEAAGARLINRDRMWHYTEGLRNWNPIWTNHGIRILPGPSSLWLDATGKRLPPPLYPGLRYSGHARAHHANAAMITPGSCSTSRSFRKEFALSGSEQNPDFTEQGLAPGRQSGVGDKRDRVRSRRSRSRALTSSSRQRSTSSSSG